MLTKMDKAWVAGLVTFGALTASTFFGIDINAVMQGSIAGLISMGLTYAVPNAS